MENANCTMLNVSGYTPLDLACQSGHTQVVSLLLRSGQFSAAYLQRSDMPHTSLMLAAKQGHNECIALLVKHGFDVNRKLPGGNGGTALHEAALHGKVDTVRYLIQCGVDVQRTNSQGHTALDIVNMYVDPRTASLMKQVLQDALAQLARSRIAHQHATGQAATSSHRPQPGLQQPPGFSYFPGSGQPVVHRPMSEESTQHRQYAVSSQRQTSHPSSAYPHHSKGQSTSHQIQFNPQVAGHSHQSMVHPHQSAGNTHQSAAHAHQSAGHPHQSAVHPHQATGHPHQATTGHSHHPAGPTGGFPSPPISRSNFYTAQSGQPPSAQAYQQQRVVNQESSGMAQNVQHIYPKPGTPEAVRKAPGIGGDLAAIIAAKAASRKPIVSSPTRKESAELTDEHFTRSATLSGEPSMQEARNSAQHRRSSVSDRSSASPERGDPPTLPRRAQAGPPPFKPVPPPNESRGKGAGGELESSKRHMFSSDSERLQAPKPQPTAPPPVSEENELMAKLKRRQNKIIEAEQTAPEPVPEEAREEEEPVQPKPPPPPQRKTPTLNSVPQQSDAQEQAAPQEPVLAKQKKAKPPPPKPKDAEAEMSPWQQELAARRARMADHERESELEQGGDKDSQSQEKPDPIPKPAPKPKRNMAPPSGAKPAIPSPAQEQSVSLQLLNPRLVPSPVVPRTAEPPEDTLPSAVPPVIPVKREPVTVVVEEPEPPAMLSEVSTVVTDQLSRSTSMSSLTTATGSPQLSCVEHMPVSEWLTSYKLADYVTVFEANGYDTTELTVGITQDELQEMGVTKIGHRKKLITALASWPQKDHFFHVKPESVSVWLSVLKMSQYEETLLEAGYDDVDFICDMTLDDLHDIGITKKGHVKRLLQGIGELTDLVKNYLSRVEHHPVLPSAQLTELNSNPLTTTSEHILPPPDSWTDGAPEIPEKVDFSRMRGLLEMKMGVNRVLESESEAATGTIPLLGVSVPPEDKLADTSESPSPVPPNLPPKRSTRPKGGKEEFHSGAAKSFSVEDITAALGEKVHKQEAVAAGMQNEFDELNTALGFTDEDQHVAEEPEPQPDQLLADIDDMLADLTTHLDFMIPGST
ncbi:Caskin-1 [Geodia barretti]|nr:Caskin-1 [Geodia barretti]